MQRRTFANKQKFVIAIFLITNFLHKFAVCSCLSPSRGLADIPIIFAENWLRGLNTYGYVGNCLVNFHSRNLDYAFSSFAGKF